MEKQLKSKKSQTGQKPPTPSNPVRQRHQLGSVGAGKPKNKVPGKREAF